MFTSFPQYYREYFYIFPVTGKDIPYDMARFLVGEFDLELVGDEVAFNVKGSKENVEKCVEKYSQFFENWERIDKRLLEIWDESDRLVSRIKDIPLYFGNADGKVNKEEYNKEIDYIISKLKNLKVY
jgi:hypothetical protein